MRRESGTSDVSMGRQSLPQGGSLRGSSSMLFRHGSTSGDLDRQDERMSVDGDRGRESSVTVSL
jgi:hypothetical protein